MWAHINVFLLALSKLLESFVVGIVCHLMDYLTSADLLLVQLHGFWRSHSIETTVMHCLRNCLSVFDRSDLAAEVRLDL
jgi:hypothetical protein